MEYCTVRTNLSVSNMLSQDAGTAALGLSPCTAYVAMLPYAYTTNDVAQLFAPFGKLARVLVLRDKQTRLSRGVAFVQFARAEDCAKAVVAMNKVWLEGMTLAVSLCRDNGRSREFTKKRKYTTSQRCFECGDLGHVSYECPRNVLGTRERPVTTGGKSSRKNLKKKRKKFAPHERAHYFNDEGVTNILYVIVAVGWIHSKTSLSHGLLDAERRLRVLTTRTSPSRCWRTRRQYLQLQPRRHRLWFLCRQYPQYQQRFQRVVVPNGKQTATSATRMPATTSELLENVDFYRVIWAITYQPCDAYFR